MRIAIAGLGNVGAGVVRLLRDNADIIAGCAGQRIEIVAVSARDRSKTRDCDLSHADWVDPLALAGRDDVDLVVELIGGASGAAADLVRTALQNKKHVVTANKALIAAQGGDLAALALRYGVQLAFEASVCGAMPIVKLLREGLAANRISSVRGILNGTCNFILTRMENDAMDFDAALTEAQNLGYAEADPTADIDGHDAANKLAILSALAFGGAPDLDSVFIEGIRSITLRDLLDAAAKGGRIKLLGIAERVTRNDGTQNIVQRVQPVFVSYDDSLAFIDGAMNAVAVSCDYAGDILLQGRGAGGDATASAVVADIIDIARGYRYPAFGVSYNRSANTALTR